jgi:hypothetical protein
MEGKFRDGRINKGKWGLTPLATTTVLEAMIPVSTEGQTPFPLVYATVPEFPYTY